MTRQALSHELSARYLTPLLQLALARAGRPALEAFVAEWNVGLPALQDETNWVSLRFCEALVEWLATHMPMEDIESNVTAHITSPATMGFIRPVLRAVGSPNLLYARMPQFTDVLNKVSRVTVLGLKPGHIRVTYGPRPGMPAERSDVICRLRKAQLVAGPMFWGLPPAILTEHACQAHGQEQCIYDLRWTHRVRAWGLLVGALVGGAVGVAAGAGWWALSLAAAAGMTGNWFDARRQIRALREFGDEQAQGLRDAVRAADRRFVEILEAKAEVEKKVEERTAELHAAGGQLAESLRKVEEMSRVKDEFLANVSHELRTPLTLILAPLEYLLTEEGLPPESRDYLRAMQRAAWKLHALVDDLLDLSRMEAGQLRLSVTRGDLVELARASVEQFQTLASRRGVTVALAAPDHGVEAWVDAGRLEFVLNNLFSNAFKFTPRGGTITLRVLESADALCLEVQDTGAGIAPDAQEHVFERFVRFENPLVPRGAGAGIGLAMVKGIVEAHGGTVSLHSEVGVGTTVGITLKRGKEHLTDDVLDRRFADVPVPFGRRAEDAGPRAQVQLGEGDQEWLDRPDAPADAPRVLVVEDNADIRGFLVRVLGRRYRVLEAADGVEGWELARAQIPDAVVSDVMMPRMDGNQLLARLKGDLATRAIPVVLLTARKGPERILEGLEGGADDYLTKPFNARELLARVEVQLRLRRLTTEQVQSEKLILLGTLAAGMAHEVNNPAGAILASLPRLRKDMEGKMPERALNLVDTCVDCAQRIVNLVEDLLLLGRPDRMDARLWNPHEGIEAALRVLKHRAPPEVAINLHLEFQGHVVVRPAAINQVFLNLLDNALKAVGKRGTIDVTTRAEAGGMSVTVADSGPGIPADKLERIFDPFFTTREPGQGTGLGLHISRRVALEHGGRLEATSTAGEGARFKLWLPLSQQDLSIHG
jgi:signal transduction histidine kinase